jgi:hypothetical protein
MPANLARFLAVARRGNHRWTLAAAKCICAPRMRLRAANVGMANAAVAKKMTLFDESSRAGSWALPR